MREGGRPGEAERGVKETGRARGRQGETGGLEGRMGERGGFRLEGEERERPRAMSA